MGLCCLATDVSAIPELIRGGETGLLVPPGNREQLRDALASLIADPAMRERLGRAASNDVRQRFSTDPGLDRLAARFAPLL